MKLTDQVQEQLSEELGNATRAGSGSQAFRILRSGDAGDGQRIMLRAGFSVSSRKEPLFWLYTQNDVVRACQARSDGFAMQAAHRPTVATAA